MTEAFLIVRNKTPNMPCQLYCSYKQQSLGLNKGLNRCFTCYLSKQIISKNSEITSLVRAKKQCLEKLLLEKNKMDKLKRIRDAREKCLLGYVHVMENKLSQREQEIYQLRCDHSLDEIQNEINQFSHKESMFKNLVEVENMIVDLTSQYMVHFHSMSSENKNLRLDIDRIDADYCHQLSKIKSTNNSVFNSLTAQIQRVENERDELAKKYSKILIEAQKENVVLLEKIESLKHENTHVNHMLHQLESHTSKIIIEEQKNKSLLRYKVKNLSENIVQVNDLVSQLKDYLPTIEKSILVLISENKNLRDKSNKMENILNKEQIKNIKLQENITLFEDQIIKEKNGKKENINIKKLNEKIISLKQENAEVKHLLKQFQSRLQPSQKTNSKPKLEHGDGNEASAKSRKVVQFEHFSNDLKGENKQTNKQRNKGNIHLSSKTIPNLKSKNHDLKIKPNQMGEIDELIEGKDIKQCDNVMSKNILLQPKSTTDEDLIIKENNIVLLENKLKEEQLKNSKLQNKITELKKDNEQMASKMNSDLISKKHDLIIKSNQTSQMVQTENDLIKGLNIKQCDNVMFSIQLESDSTTTEQNMINKRYFIKRE